MNFLDLVKRGLVEKKRKATSAHYPTNASCIVDGKFYGQCLRQQWYQWKGVEESNPSSFIDQLKMYMGNAIHEGLIDIAKRVDDKIQSEVSFVVKHTSLKYEIHGRIDGIYWNDGVPVGVEIKSSYGKKVDDIKRYGIPDNYEMQAICYLYARPDIQKFEMPFIARDSFYVTTFEITRENNKVFTMDGIIKNWELLEKYLETDKLPPCSYEATYTDETSKKMYQEYLDESTAKKPYTYKQWSGALSKSGELYHDGDYHCKLCYFRDKCKEDIK